MVKKYLTLKEISIENHHIESQQSHCPHCDTKTRIKQNEYIRNKRAFSLYELEIAKLTIPKYSNGALLYISQGDVRVRSSKLQLER